MKFGLKQYHKPTPAKMRKIGDAILAAGTVLTLTAAYMGERNIVFISAGLTAIGKFFTNYFSE